MTDTTTPPTPIEDGGPAFAAQGPDRYAFQTGMSLRDWFAGQALGTMNWESHSVKGLAERAYLIADEMIEVRQFKVRQ